MLKMMLTDTFLAVCCLFTSMVWAGQDLAAADWSVRSSHSLAVNAPSDAAILALVKKLKHLDDPSLTVCSSRFADLRHSGSLSLVVSTASGRPFCDTEIIDKTASGFELYDTDSSSLDVRDIDGTGSVVAVADVDLTYEGTHHCVASWPVIYSWTGNGYNDVSSKYRPFYEQRLDSLNKEIAALSSAGEQTQAPAINQESAPELTTTRHVKLVPLRTGAYPPPSETVSPTATPPPNLNLGNADCVKAEAAKIERFLGSPDAGMNDAIEWANSDDPWKRDFASGILFDIGTPGAIRYLETLSKDTNSMVAGSAKTDLDELAKGGRQPHKIKRREDLPG